MDNMITVITRFQLPAGVTADQIRAAFDEAAPRFRNVPGLVRKQFLRSKDCRTAGGVYLWNDEPAARAFTMGNPTNEVGHQADEGPQTVVTLTHGFWIGKHEVTQVECLAVTGENPSGLA
jgi:heme-degrading monooxygenase HmoA